MVDISVHGIQGHSSVPPEETPIGILAHALANLEDKKQPSRFGHSVEHDTMLHVAPFASFAYKLVLGNLWLFDPLVSLILSKDPSTDAIQRTTTAITIVKAGIKENMVPADASALINHRIHPADDTDTVVQQDIDIIEDSRVEVKLLSNHFKATNVSSYDSNFLPFQVLANSVLQIFPDAVLTPGVSPTIYKYI